jgi:hypothetical protein
MYTMRSLRVRQLGGLALLASALLGVVVTLGVLLDPSQSSPLVELARLGAPLCLLLGLPAIQATQPATGRAGQVGLGLMGLAAAIAFVVTLRSLAGGADFAPVVPFASAFAGMVGDVLVGALTVRTRVFPTWVGWLLAVSGLINVGTGLLSGAIDLIALAVFGAVLGLLAIAGYGWTIIRLGRADGGIQKGHPLRT